MFAVEIIDATEPANMIFLCTSTPSTDKLNNDLRADLSLDDALHLHLMFGHNMDPVRKAAVDMQAGMLCRWYGDTERAKRIFVEVKEKYGFLPRVRSQIKKLGEVISLPVVTT